MRLKYDGVIALGSLIPCKQAFSESYSLETNLPDELLKEFHQILLELLPLF